MDHVSSQLIDDQHQLFARCAEVYTELCGVVEISRLYNLYCSYSSAKLDMETVVMHLFNDRSGAARSAFWTHDEKIYAIHRNLVVSPDHPDAAKLEAFKKMLVQRHDLIPQKKLAVKELISFDFMQRCLALDSARYLGDFLDENLTDKESSSQRVIATIINIYRFEPEFTTYTAYFDSLMQLDSEAKETALELLSSMINHLPRWFNNGWTSADIQDVEDGKKIIRSDTGTLEKIDPDDPCPCGSGISFKNCCGR